MEPDAWIWCLAEGTNLVVGWIQFAVLEEGGSGIFAADGKTLTATDLAGLIQVWDLATGKPVGPPAKVDGGAPEAVSRDGNRILTGHGEDNTARFRDTVTGKAGSVQHRGSVDSVAISPDGTLLLTGSYDHTAKIWDAVTEMQDRFISFAHPVLSWCRNQQVIRGWSALLCSNYRHPLG